ncbi:DUF4189 domain-containing protein [Pararoseomonas baculiformis]|uniref:DUF4189 domain-containing protein n=1 Tax=Pararoseomonas baculiformis TaxID=2820812 RepID=UPI001ADF70BD|nr:DUF4189 domain-containing protein [Pararoseomonas baculiformis]
MGLVLLAGLLAPAGALAQADSQMCRIECAALFAERAQNTATVQSCLVRCAARTAALGKANVTGTMAMPTPQTPWTALPDSRRQAPAARPQEARRQAARTPQREAAARQGRPAPERGAVASAQPPAPAPAPAVPPAPNAPSSLFGSLIAAQAAMPGAAAASPPAAAAAQPSRGGFGAIYVAAAPSRAYGLSVGVADRGSAHRSAESSCHGGVGNACRLAADFSARCAAVAHALRSNGAVVMTAHPSTYTVMAATIGTGATREDAEREARAACAQRGRGLVCQVTEARCAG